MTSHEDLEGDIRNLAVLVETVTDMAIDFPADNLDNLRDHVNKIGSLRWIARDLTAQLSLNAADGHHIRMTGGARNG